MCCSGGRLEALRSGTQQDPQVVQQIAKSAPCSSSGPEHLGLGLRVQEPRSAPEFAGLHLDLRTIRPSGAANDESKLAGCLGGAGT
ncbi:unnamed protein product [Gadus morhua 'NCC']